MGSYEKVRKAADADGQGFEVGGQHSRVCLHQPVDRGGGEDDKDAQFVCFFLFLLLRMD